MVNLRKHKLLAGLIWVWTCTALLWQQANEDKMELKFDVGDKAQRWVIRIRRERAGKPGEERVIEEIEDREEMVQSSIRPKYVGVLYVGYRQEFPDCDDPGVIQSILSTPSGKLLSQQQIDLLSTGACIRRLGAFGDTVNNHYHFRIYAVSEKEARQTTEAFIEILANRSKEETQFYKDAILELRRTIAETKRKIQEKEPEAEAARARFEEMKKTARFLDYKKARETIGSLNEKLNALDIDIAGLQARVSTIETYKSGKKVSNPTTLGKLDQMLSEYAIELADDLAKKEAFMEIRRQAKAFYDLYHLQNRLPRQVQSLRDNLPRLEQELRENKKRLNSPEKPPPKVFENKLTIYPVRVD